MSKLGLRYRASLAHLVYRRSPILLVIWFWFSASAFITVRFSVKIAMGLWLVSSLSLSLTQWCIITVSTWKTLASLDRLRLIFVLGQNRKFRILYPVPSFSRLYTSAAWQWRDYRFSILLVLVLPFCIFVFWNHSVFRKACYLPDF